MFSQEEIDAALNDAQSAVDALTENADTLTDRSEAAAVPPPPVAAYQPIGAAPRPLAASPDSFNRILKLKVPVVVRLAERRMLLGEIMKMMPGTILEFSRTVEQDLDLLVNNHQIGSGVAVKVNERFGLRVSYVGDVRRRLNSLKAS